MLRLPIHFQLVRAVVLAGCLACVAAVLPGVPARAELSPAASAGTRTRFGAAVKPRTGETYQQALARYENTYGGRLGAIRYFDPNTPNEWPSLNARTGNRPLIVSFKIAPSTVLSGSHDTVLRNWFAAAPTDRPTYWSYIHEPEDDIARGEFTAAQYRAAWQRVSQLSVEAGNPQLHATLILMCYSANPRSGRDWRDYFAGPASVDVLGWDCYNHAWRSGEYGEPDKLLGNAVRVSREAGVPWGISELGSVLVQGDSGAGRADWLRRHARYLYDNGAAFVTYFDTNGGGRGTDYRLLDASSQQAWRDVVSDQVP